VDLFRIRAACPLDCNLLYNLRLHRCDSIHFMIENREFLFPGLGFSTSPNNLGTSDEFYILFFMVLFGWLVFLPFIAQLCCYCYNFENMLRDLPIWPWILTFIPLLFIEGMIRIKTLLSMYLSIR
jgi:hypothetical protein